MSFEPVRPLTSDDDVQSFDCGREALNRFLQRHALNNQRANSSKTYVSCSYDGAHDGAYDGAHDGARPVVAGYYSLCVSSMQYADAPERLSKGLARHPVPVMLLARLAVDIRYQSLGLGRALLKDAMLRTLQVSEIVGVRAMLVHAKDEAARGWYLHWQFEPSPVVPNHLVFLIKDIRAALE